MATTTADDAQNKLTNIGLLILGAAILIIHIVLFKFNQAVFSIFISLYVVFYTIVVLWYVYKYASRAEQRDFDFITYVSFYTLFLEIALVVLAMVVLMVRALKKPAVASPPGVFKF